MASLGLAVLLTATAGVSAVSVGAAAANPAPGNDLDLVVVDPGAFVTSPPQPGHGGLIDLHVASGTTLPVWQSPYDSGAPAGIAVDSQGYLYVADPSAFPGDTGGIIRVNPTSGSTTPITSARLMINPRGIVVGPDGDLYVADPDGRPALGGEAGTPVVIKVDPDTGDQTIVASGGLMANPLAIAVEPRPDQGPNAWDLIVADKSSKGGDGAIIRIDPSTATQVDLADNGDFGDPGGVVVAPNGDIYVVDPNWDNGDGGVIRLPASAIQPGDPVIHPQISTNEVTGHDTWGNPQGITLGPKGNIFVADPDKSASSNFNGGVFMVDPSTGVVTAVSQNDERFVHPMGLVVVPHQHPPAEPDPTGPYRPMTYTQPASSAPVCHPYEYTVPPGVTRLGFEVIGHGGNEGRNKSTGIQHVGGLGGLGARARGVLNVTPGEKIYAGAARNNSGGSAQSLSYSGGDMSYLSTTDPDGLVARYQSRGCDIDRANLLVVAGGGGGGGAAGDTYGGKGGAAGRLNPGTLNGDPGHRGAEGAGLNDPGPGGKGGTLNAGGVGGDSSYAPLQGAYQTGGTGQGSGAENSGDGGGAGGGLYGGGGGASGTSAGGGGGGGGSSYLSPSTSGGTVVWAATLLTTPEITLTPLGAASSVKLTVQPNPVDDGSPVALTATVSPTATQCPLSCDSGTVTFRSDGAVLGTAKVDPTSGVATLSAQGLSHGVRHVTATFGGNGFFAASTSATVDVTVTAPYPTVDAGYDFNCGIRTDQRVACWGADSSRQSMPPTGTFTQVSAGTAHACGVRADGTVVCWGGNDQGESSPPAGTFTQVAAGRSHTCGIRTAGTLACWGSDADGQSSPPAGTFTQVSAARSHSCALRTTGTVACWGENDTGESSPPAGTFTQVSTGGFHTCGIHRDGTAACWGDNAHGQATPPSGTFAQVTAGKYHTCGIRPGGAATCWGWNADGQSTPPAGATFAHLSAGGVHTCGVRIDGGVACWGSNSAFQLGAPSLTDLRLPGMVVSKVRFAGPGGTGGAADDGFVEVTNTSSLPVTLAGGTMSYGGGRVALPGATLVPDGHFLVAAAGYTLATGADLAPAGLDLSGGWISVADTAGAVADKVGLASAAAGNREGAGLAVPASTSTQYAFVRTEQAANLVDSNDNAADFTLVSAHPAGLAGSTLGNPSPDNTSSPVRSNPVARSTLLDPSVAASKAPNRVITGSVAGGDLRLTVRRTITNTSTAPITKMRVRITDITTVGTPGNHAVLRWINSTSGSQGPLGWVGLTVNPANQVSGGGLDSTAGVALPGGQLAPGQSVSVAFTFRVDRGGSFSFRYDVDAT